MARCALGPEAMPAARRLCEHFVSIEQRRKNTLDHVSFIVPAVDKKTPSIFLRTGSLTELAQILACAGEESGLLGSAWFVAQPPVPLGSMVANFNIDMPQIFGVTADIAAIGEDTSELGDVLRAVAAEFPVGDGQTVVVRGDSNPSAGSFYRSDQVNFAKAGIPALYLNPGSDYIEPLPFDPAAYEEAHYHQVTDEVRDEWNLAGLERDLRIVFRTARAVANGDEIPRWRPGNEFEAAWLQLHGLD